MYKVSNRASPNNVNAILECILRNAPISRSSISEMTGITPATTTLTIARLLEDGVVCEQENNVVESSGVGRKPIPLDVCPDAYWALGVEFTKKSFQLCIVNIRGEIAYSHAAPYSPEIGKEITEYILRHIEKAFRDRPDLKERVIGVGIAVPGHARTSGPGVISNLSIWNAFDLDRIRRECPVPVFAENNVRCMALKEYLFQPDTTPDNFAYLHVSLGMYCASMIDGQLFRNNSHLSGEIGHVIVDPNGIRCECGNTGCLQTVASENYLLQNARRLYELDQHTLLRRLADSPAQLTIDTMVNAHILGDSAVSFYMKKALNYLGITTSNIAILMDPHKILLHGKMFSYPEIQEEFLRTVQSQLSFMGSINPENIVFLPYADTDGAVGGAALAFYSGLLNIT